MLGERIECLVFNAKQNVIILAKVNLDLSWILGARPAQLFGISVEVFV